MQLVGVHGNQRFDQITRTKTVQMLLESLQVQQVESYVDYLIDMFVDQSLYA